MTHDEEPSELPTSELGTKEFWDSSYELELNNFNDHGDVGEVWFGEDSAARIVRWMSSSDIISTHDSIVDLGCGNGMLLVELAHEGFENLLGVDYSEAAVKLAQKVASSQNLDIKFETCDILADATKPLNGRQFKVVLDKGTYDAISLNPENAHEKRNMYIEAVHNLLEAEGSFILTSCNWTQAELESHFQKYFKLALVLPTPKFQFGGKTGNTVTSLVFKTKCD
ncbi:EEF1A lysine methyltransferase 2 [Frankliniella fusca]|uniref:Protein-lysine N-methyltransferase KUF71_006888 n=1 Tax=Frankliniella fusca TaxID=407009 RepID=A0AAE1H9J9_9NEOP|nr:EEF1A lysine methyltransferase 2 [Frankliniella fusca]